MNNTKEKVSDLGAMKGLKKGETVSFPIDKLNTIRTNASNINAIRGFSSLSTSIDRKNRIITVSRMA